MAKLKFNQNFLKGSWIEDLFAKPFGMMSFREADSSLADKLGWENESRPLFNFVSHEITGNQKGATMVEYGVMVALIWVVSITVVFDMGDNVSVGFIKVENAMGGFE